MRSSCSKNDYASGIELASQFGNVIMTRTFSKLYGLAGLRVGWGYAPEHIVDAIERVRMPFNVNLPAQAAAIAALEDDAFTEQSLAHNAAELPRLAGELQKLGLSVIDGVGNFVVAEFPADERQDGGRGAGLSEGSRRHGAQPWRATRCRTICASRSARSRPTTAALALLKEFLGK